MKTVCLTDIHGYLDRSLDALEALETEIGESLIQENKWVSDHTLVFNGDAFDRGPQNREALEWVMDNADVYNIGNHEFFAIFPDVTEKFLSEEYLQKTGEKDNYWQKMSDKIRLELIRNTASEDITAGFREHKYIYTHAGSEKPDIEKLNGQLAEAGQKLLEGYKKGPERYREVQKEIVWTEETSRGTELRSEYPELFEVRRSPDGLKGGIIWTRFNQLETEKPQVVGHTTGKYLKQNGFDYNPQTRGGAININTIRDSFETGTVALTVEDEVRIETYEFMV